MDSKREYTRAGLLTISYDLLLEKLGEQVDEVFESGYLYVQGEYAISVISNDQELAAALEGMKRDKWATYELKHSSDEAPTEYSSVVDIRQPM
jgi:hypothetical protein